MLTASGWDFLHTGTGREHLDDPAVPPTRSETGTTTFRFSVAGKQPERPAATRRKSLRSMVRPYTRTGGRTKSDLALEALVSTTDHGRATGGSSTQEYRRICALCVETRSVAEVAALLSIPLGVGKILVEDLASDGMVLIHQPGLVTADRSSMELLQRVLNGIQAL